MSEKIYKMIYIIIEIRKIKLRKLNYIKKNCTISSYNKLIRTLNSWQENNLHLEVNLRKQLKNTHTFHSVFF